MSWAEHHSTSERLAAEAEAAVRSGQADRAFALYAEAAVHEQRALEAVPDQKAKTRGITAVSAVALNYKAREYALATQLAHRTLGTDTVPQFARDQMQEMLQMIWTAEAAARAGIRFSLGEVLVSVKGGEVVYGGAPLDLIAAKVSEVQAVLFRTAEMLLHKSFRKRGSPGADVQSVFTPWLFQAPAGSYQFAIRIQEPPQTELFPEVKPTVDAVSRTFLEIARATATGAAEDLRKIVPDDDYRAAFLKLSRNLSPTGRRYAQLDVRDATSPTSPPISFLPASRENINEVIRKERPPGPDGSDEPKVFKGILRALHLDQDWLEIALDEPPGEHMKITDAGEALDDVVGPMVNRRVAVQAIRASSGKFLYRDIELDE